MFTQQCFIRKNTKELVDKLYEIGYRNYGNPFQFTDFNILYTTIDGYYVPYRVQVDSSWIDCGTNEELFLAIASLRDDSDIRQWFTDGEKWVISDIHSLLCMKEYFKIIGFNHKTTHKATVEELIKHFTI